MNGSLGWALKELEFNVTRATGAVVRSLKGEAVVGNHLVLRVELPALSNSGSEKWLSFQDAPVR